MKLLQVFLLLALFSFSLSESQITVPKKKPHVILHSFAQSGNLNPTIQLAQELKSRGFFRVSLVILKCGEHLVNTTGVDYILIDAEDFVDILSPIVEKAPNFTLFEKLSHLRTFPFIIVDSIDQSIMALIDRFKDDKPDFIITNTISSFGIFDFAEYLDIPYAIIHPTVISPMYSLFHLDSPTYIPYQILFRVPSYDQTSFQRFLSFIIKPIFQFVVNAVVVSVRWKIRSELGLPFIASATSSANGFVPMVVSTSYFGWEDAMPLPPNVQLVGPFEDNSNVPKLSEDLESWMNSTKDIIYVAFGSVVPLTQDLVTTLTTSLGNTSYPVLWALRKPFHKYLPSSLPKNVRLESWVNQKGVLAHPSIKMMITHCGMNSISEALFNGVPLIGVPQVADQTINAALLQKNKAGIAILAKEITETMITDAIHQIASDTSYKKNAVTLSHLMRHAGGRKRAAELIENAYLDGTSHLIPKDLLLPWYQRWNLDIYVQLILLFVAVYWILKKMWTFCQRRQKKKEKLN